MHPLKTSPPGHHHRLLWVGIHLFHLQHPSVIARFYFSCIVRAVYVTGEWVAYDGGVDEEISGMFFFSVIKLHYTVMELKEESACTHLARIYS